MQSPGAGPIGSASLQGTGVQGQPSSLRRSWPMAGVARRGLSRMRGACGPGLTEVVDEPRSSLWFSSSRARFPGSAPISYP